MPSNVTLNESLDLIEVSHRGFISNIEFYLSRSQAFHILKEHGGKNTLIDMRGARFSMTPYQIYHFAKTTKPPVPIRVAVLLNESDNDAVTFRKYFLEAGADAVFFTDYKEALEYLQA